MLVLKAVLVVRAKFVSMVQAEPTDSQEAPSGSTAVAAAVPSAAEPSSSEADGLWVPDEYVEVRLPTLYCICIGQVNKATCRHPEPRVPRFPGNDLLPCVYTDGSAGNC